MSVDYNPDLAKCPEFGTISIVRKIGKLLIHLTRDWAEVVQNRLKSCTLCMTFLSQAFGDSENCRDEVHYALEQEKRILPFYLEKVELGHGLDLRLSRYQAFRMSDRYGMPELLGALRGQRIFERCQRRPTSAPNLEQGAVSKLKRNPTVRMHSENEKKTTTKKNKLDTILFELELLVICVTIFTLKDIQSWISHIFFADSEKQNERSISEDSESRDTQSEGIVEGVVWTLDDNGEMIVTSTGYEYTMIDGSEHLKIPDYDLESGDGRPWAAERNHIRVLKITGSITGIGRNAFSNCDNLETVEIYTNTMHLFIDGEAFAGSSRKIKSFYKEKTGHPSVYSEDGVLYSGVGAMTLIRYPTGREGKFDIPDGVNIIDSYAFFGCEALTTVTIPESVIYIWNYAFSDCENLIEITIPNGVETIEAYTFANCEKLTEVYIPDSVQKIESGAFDGCTVLTSVEVPADAVVEDGAFPETTTITRRAAPSDGEAA